MACATLKRRVSLDPLESPRSSPVKKRRFGSLETSPSIPIPPSARDGYVSPFATTPLTTEEVTTNLKKEVKRLKRRKLLEFGDESASHRTMNPNTNAADSSTSLKIPGTTEDKPLFTFRQVGLICERMLKEKEVELRELYEQTLATKLAEQYDTFVKFTFDQLQKQFERSAEPSYLS